MIFMFIHQDETKLYIYRMHIFEWIIAKDVEGIKDWPIKESNALVPGSIPAGAEFL